MKIKYTVRASVDQFQILLLELIDSSLSIYVASS